ncbi:MAG: D-alanyl-D-alanine carboxypeptidase [Clostridia bacterium]|nr:D-alanyl-D-alanine carboxypeptidase [Clostridia bacterium]
MNLDNKKVRIVLGLVLIVLFTFQWVCADDFNENEPCVDTFSKHVQSVNNGIPVIDSTSAIVMDMESGRILFEKNGNSKKNIASTTKIMTAIVAIENGNLEDTVVISKRAASVWGSTIKLKEGEELTLKELLYGLMLKSGNDAAIAIAEHIGGSVEGFVERMNQKAKDLGAVNTSFKSPHGLDMEGHFSTAHDLAVITQYALKNTTFSKIVGTTSFSITGRSLQNTNEMLSIYPGADGVKTGYTGGAGRCLVASATRDKWRIISVVLGCPTRNKRADASRKILDYSFNNYKPYVLLKENESIIRLPVLKGMEEDVPILAGKKIKLPIRNDEESLIKREVELPDILQAPVSDGAEVGKIKFLVNGKVIAESPLKAGYDVRRKGILDYLGDIFKEWSIVLRGEMF